MLRSLYHQWLEHEVLKSEFPGQKKALHFYARQVLLEQKSSNSDDQVCAEVELAVYFNIKSCALFTISDEPIKKGVR